MPILQNVIGKGGAHFERKCDSFFCRRLPPWRVAQKNIMNTVSKRDKRTQGGANPNNEKMGIGNKIIWICEWGLLLGGVTTFLRKIREKKQGNVFWVDLLLLGWAMPRKKIVNAVRNEIKHWI